MNRPGMADMGWWCAGNYSLTSNFNKFTWNTLTVDKLEFASEHLVKAGPPAPDQQNPGNPCWAMLVFGKAPKRCT